jgi:hypothetical protein
VQRKYHYGFFLFGNSSYRFEQFDGSLSMPYSSNSRYHMAGKIVACPVPVFKRILENSAKLLAKSGAANCVVIPPLPCYLLAGCCQQPGHSSNVNSIGHNSTLLTT